MTGLTLDTGALLDIERGGARMRALLARALEHRLDIAVPAGALAKAWRGGPRQARLAMLLNDALVDIPELDDLTARAVGVICGRSGHPDIVDVQVYLVAHQRDHTIVTSDPDDMRKIDPRVRLIEI